MIMKTFNGSKTTKVTRGGQDKPLMRVARAEGIDVTELLRAP
jgi:hypothetical protein